MVVTLNGTAPQAKPYTPWTTRIQARSSPNRRSVKPRPNMSMIEWSSPSQASGARLRGPRGRVIIGYAVGRRRAAVGPADRRGLVAITKRNPVGHEFSRLRLHDQHSPSLRRARSALRNCLRRSRDPASDCDRWRDSGRRGRHCACPPAGARSHRTRADPALRQPASTPSGFQPRSTTSSRSGIEPQLRGRVIEMGGIADEEDGADLVAVGHHVARGPASAPR